MAGLRIYLLGSPQIELDSTAIETDRNKAIALLAYLAVSKNRYARDVLAAMLWPEYDKSRAYAYLRRTLWELNNLLGEGWIEADRETIGLTSGPDVWLDVDEFEKYTQGCLQHEGTAKETCRNCMNALIEAVELYRGDFLAGFGLRDSPEFDSWQFFQSESLRQKMTAVLGRLTECLLLVGNTNSAIDYSLRWQAVDPLNEEAHRRLMTAYFQAGQRGSALRQYQECRRILGEELNVEPEAETVTLYEKIRSGVLEDVPTQQTQVEALAPLQRPIKIPSQPTPFIGREEDLAKILLMIQDRECRLLSLIGPGGIGKTRLAIEVGSRAHEHFEGHFIHGIYFIPLAPLSSADALVPTIAESLNYSFQGEEASGRSPETQHNQLIDFLREKEALLILDNFEHLIEGTALLSDIAAEAAGVKLLVTSRERLRLREEWSYDVQGLDYPQEDSPASPGDYSAVQLFMHNVEKVQAGTWVPVEEMPHISRICQLLEGVPLGLELAAAWTKSLSPHEIAEEIERSLDFLVTPMRGVAERHHSLRAVFDHSWKLLEAEEQKIFARLSVFRGAFTREAAFQVAGAQLPILSVLIDKSLLRRTSTGRYETHQLVKQYAAQKLSEFALEEEQTRDRHARFFAEQLTHDESDLKGPAQIQALNRIESELEDIRAAWYWSVVQVNFDALYSIGVVLYLFLIIRNRFQEGFDETRKAIRQLRQSAIDSSEQAHLEATAFILGMQSSYLSAMEHYDESIELQRECLTILDQVKLLDQRWDEHKHASYLNFIPVLIFFGGWVTDQDSVGALYQKTLQRFEQEGELWGMAFAKFQYADVIRYSQHDLGRARQLLEESYHLFQRCGNPWGLALSLNGLSRTSLLDGDYQAVIRYAMESQEIYDEMGDRWHMINNYFGLGMASVALGSYERAKTYYQEALSLARELGSRFVISSVYDSLGYADFLMGDYEAAEVAYRESLSISQAVGDKHGQGMALSNLADVKRTRGEWDDARELYRQGLDFLGKESELWQQATLWKKLGIVQRETGSITEAKNSLSKALSLADLGSSLPEMLNVLIEIALLIKIEGEMEKAVEILELCREHPALPADSKVKCEQILGKIETEMPAESFESARKRAGYHQLADILAELLP